MIKCTPVPTKKDCSHFLQDSDFCRLTHCQCTVSCNKHWKFTPQKEVSTAPIIYTSTTLHDDVELSLQQLKELIHNKQSSHTKHIKTVRIVNSQNNIGANTSVTNNKSIIHLYQDIKPYAIGGVNKDDPAIICQGKGYISVGKKKTGIMPPLLLRKHIKSIASHFFCRLIFLNVA